MKHLLIFLIVIIASCIVYAKIPLKTVKHDNITLPFGWKCTVCTAVVQAIEKEGCDIACSVIPPPGDALCSLILGTSGLCEQIIEWLNNGNSLTEICGAGYLNYCTGSSASASGPAPSTSSSGSSGGATSGALRQEAQNNKNLPVTDEMFYDLPRRSSRKVKIQKSKRFKNL